MRSLPLISLLLVLSYGLIPQSDTSPHGKTLTISCSDCHNTKGWKMIEGEYSFSHQKTDFPLIGQHQAVDCRSCHQTLVFDEAKGDCISCHTDVHQQTVGFDCARCHNPESWLVSSITEIHRMSRFPLTGAHFTTACTECHKSASDLLFEPLEVDCYSCHEKDYVAAKSPDHIANQYATNCVECHNINAFSWSGAGINHAFFPLNKGHAIDCAQCHKPGDPYNSISPDCVSCHLTDYQQALNPNHAAVAFSTQCNECHTLSPGWSPAEFKSHDNQFFPVYSGKHSGEWESCTDCHTNQSDFTQFSCIDCHEHNQSDMNKEHDDVNGYLYNSQACFECHPKGDSDKIFNHSLSNFPLTGAHNTVSCADCHTSGYSGTSTTCSDCHIQQYNESVNPNHGTLGLSLDCLNCHTTEPDWIPASFSQHDDYYVLNGAHKTIANNCFDCHEGNYVDSPNLCFSCHSEEFNQTTNPPHLEAGFSTNCETCHSETAWTPANFDHDAQYFPIYSGKHLQEWGSCTECHTTPSNYQVFSCIDCHEHNQPDTDNEHLNIGGYVYESGACYACHPTGDGDDGFNHNLTQFPLTGAHITTSCISCHANGYTGTTTVCSECHSAQYNQTTNPNHQTLGITQTCETCHTTQPDWKPAAFPIHNDFYALTGAHQTIAGNCFECHEGNYTNTPSDCFTCHTSDFNQTANPNHVSLGIPTSCETCHTTIPDWKPATFPIHNNYYVLLGAHQQIANNCADCHEGNYNTTANTCFGCHETDYNQATNPPHASAQFPIECESCHTETAWDPSTFNHDAQYFPIYSGEHDGEWNQCADCHTNPSNYAVFSCIDCHEHNQADMADEHDDVSGYTWNSNACLDCHPNGEGDKSMIKLYRDTR